MSVSDPIADMLTKIRNAGMARFEKVDLATSLLKLEIIKVLKSEGYIKNFKVITEDEKPIIRVFLKYGEKQESVIRGIRKNFYTGKASVFWLSKIAAYTKWLWNSYCFNIHGSNDREKSGRKACRRRTNLFCLVMRLAVCLV